MKRTCFTLIELLVVIAVIALLVAILIPVLRSSKQRARAVLCGSNIKQLTVGLFMYETENQTFPYGYRFVTTPPPGGYPGNSVCDKPGWWWLNYISESLGANGRNNTALWCPSRQIRDPLLDHVLHSNYGVNRSICKSSELFPGFEEDFVGTPLRSSDMPHPGRTLLIVDSGYSIISWWHATDVPPVTLGSTIEDAAYVPGLWINKDKNLWPGQEWDAIQGRHPNRTVNIGFADGHLSKSKADNLFVEKTDDGYTNHTPLWLPK
jgi:prepilin-type processing-associated H-X9-DG protein/prepilin-type N-terminal cleavage/methylation domain-containing protein